MFLAKKLNRVTSHMAKLGEITGKTRVLYSKLGEITGKSRVLQGGITDIAPGHDKQEIPVMYELVYFLSFIQSMLLSHTLP